jgi:iron complex outermembrane receptor protein
LNFQEVGLLLRAQCQFPKSDDHPSLTSPVIEQKRKYDNELAPRLAVLKQLAKPLSVYASVGRGFSPPTTAELLPSSGIIATNLNAEEGINYEAGLRAKFNSGRIYLDVNGFRFGLENTIVQRKDASGADYFENAGSTKQIGVESYLSWQIISNPNQSLQIARFGSVIHGMIFPIKISNR